MFYIETKSGSSFTTETKDVTHTCTHTCVAVSSQTRKTSSEEEKPPYKEMGTDCVKVGIRSVSVSSLWFIENVPEKIRNFPQTPSSLNLSEEEVKMIF